MVDQIISKDNAKKAYQSSVKDQKRWNNKGGLYPSYTKRSWSTSYENRQNWLR